MGKFINFDNKEIKEMVAKAIASMPPFRKRTYRQYVHMDDLLCNAGDITVDELRSLHYDLLNKIGTYEGYADDK